jgi:hypothetical protein
LTRYASFVGPQLRQPAREAGATPMQINAHKRH